MFVYKIRLVEGFRDGSIYPRAIGRGEVLIVDEQTYNKMRRSDPESVELIEKMIPNPKKGKQSDGKG